MGKLLFRTIARATLYFTLFVTGITPAVAWTGPSTAPPGGNTSTPLNVSSTAQTKAGNLGVTGQFSVTGPSATWATIINWPNTSAPGYGILVGNSASTYSEFANANGYYTLLGYSSDSLYGNGNIYVSGTIQSANSYGAGFGLISTGACGNPNPFTGGCSCPGFAPYVMGLGTGIDGGYYENMYLCY